MNKEDRKKLETTLLSAVEGILHPQHQKATKKIRKFLKSVETRFRENSDFKYIVLYYDVDGV